MKILMSALLGTFFASFAVYPGMSQTIESAENIESTFNSCLTACWQGVQEDASTRLNQCVARKVDTSRAQCMDSTKIDMVTARESCRSSCQASRSNIASAEPAPDFPEGHDPYAKPEGYEHDYWTDEKARTSSLRGPDELRIGPE